MTYKQERRRLSRAAKQAEWKAANPLLVGVSAEPGRQVLTLNRDRKPDRVSKALIGRDTKYSPSAGNCCLPDVAIYSAGYRNSESITAR